MNILNPPKDKTKVCALCDLGYRKFHPIEKHHIKYNPELIVYVHDDCHRSIHEEPFDSFIQYTENERLNYYSRQDKWWEN